MENVGRELNKLIDQRNYRARFQEMMAEVLANPEVKSFIDENKDYLTEMDIEKSYAKLYEFVQEKRKFDAQDQRMIAPGYEPQLILNFHSIDVTYVPTQDLLARKHQEEVRNRIHAVNMPKDIQDARISN